MVDNDPIHVIDLLFVLLAGSVVAVTVLRYLRVTTTIGYLSLGILAGPHVFKFIGEGQEAAGIAELGVIALMFTLGLKFSFSRLLASRKLVFGLGGAQVATGLVLVTLIAHYVFNLELHSAFVVASVLTMSSTAVVSKMLIERGELTTPHGTRSVSVLILQDLAVIPLLIIFAREASTEDSNYLIEFVKAIGLLIFLFFLAPYIMPRLVNFFASQKSDELFTIFVLAMIVGVSLLTSKAGLSAVLGAFLTGILLAESRHRYLIEEIIRPYREIFLGFFFISIGLLVSPFALIEHMTIIIAISGALLVCKPLIIFGLTKAFGSHRWTAIHTAMALGGTGEFGFVLLTTAALTDDKLLQILLGVNLVCMVMPPVLLPIVERFRTFLSQDEWLLQARDLTRIASTASGLRDHVIICGFGQGSKVIAKMFERRSIPWIALESDFEVYEKLVAEKNKHVVFGDARNSEVLIAAGIMQAKVMIISHAVHGTTVQTTHTAHSLNQHMTIIAKVLGEKQISEASSAGASFISIATMETGLAMASKALQQYGLSSHTIAHDLREIHGTAAEVGISSVLDAIDSESIVRLRELDIDEESDVLGKTAADLEEILDGTEVQFLSLIREESKIEISAETIFEDGDHILLRGRRLDLDTVESLLQKTQET